MKNYFFKIRCAAVILIAAGYGWAGGQYVPTHASILAYLFQLIIIAGILIMGTRSLSIPESERHTKNWSVTGLSIFSILLLLLNILDIIHWGYSVADLVPAALLMTGIGLWVVTIVRNMRQDTDGKYLSGNQYNIFS